MKGFITIFNSRNNTSSLINVAQIQFVDDMGDYRIITFGPEHSIFTIETMSQIDEKIKGALV